jgi:hypothetical protein
MQGPPSFLEKAAVDDLVGQGMLKVYTVSGKACFS